MSSKYLSGTVRETGDQAMHRRGLAGVLKEPRARLENRNTTTAKPMTELEVRARAEARGLHLVKCCTRDPGAWTEYGTYRIVDFNNCVVCGGPGNYGLSLEEAAEFIDAEGTAWSASRAA
jgi:hypothetical protein